MATTRTVENPRWIQSATRPVMEVIDVLIDGAATYKAGQFLARKNDGLVYVCASDEDSVHYFALQDMDTATGDETIYTRVGVVHANDEFLMNVHHDTAASALATEAEAGINYAMDVASNVVSVDLEDSGTAAKNCLRVVRPAWHNSTIQDKSTDIYGRVVVRVLQAAIDLLHT